MKKSCQILFVMMVFCLMACFAGCATAPNGQPVLAGSEPKKFESSVQHKTDVPITVRPGGRYVYVSMGDTTGHGINYKISVENALLSSDKGFQITPDPDGADYQIQGKVIAIDSFKEYWRKHPEMRNVEMLATTGAGLGLLASGAGGRAAGAVGLGLLAADFIIRAAEAASAPEVYYLELYLRVGERNGPWVDGYGGKRPIEHWSKKTTKVKRGKKTGTEIVEFQRKEKDSPIEETTSIVRSGAGNQKTVTKRERADFDYHETTFRAVIKVQAGTPINQAIAEIQDKIGSAIANEL